MNGGLCVPNVDGLRERIMVEAHSTRYSIHPGYTKIYQDLKQIYWWNKIKEAAANHVFRCINCQKVKGEQQRPAGLAQNIKIPL